VADDKTARPAQDDDRAVTTRDRGKHAPADLPTGPAAAALPTGPAAAIAAGPPPMPAGLPTGPAAVVTSSPPALPAAGPPPMPAALPTGPAAVVTSSPPALPAAAPPPMPGDVAPVPAGAASNAPTAQTEPPGFPTAAAAVILGSPPAMPGAATAPPTMPTAPAAAITSIPPAMPVGVTAPPSMPTVAGAAIHSGPPPMPGEAQPSSSALPPGVPPERYELRGEIARGGMGRVVEANDKQLGRLVAFKEALTTDTDTLRRFARETQITARLEHPSIVPVYDAGKSSNNALFYVMRKVSGRPLERLVAEAETLSQRLALIPHIVDAAQAIAHAHERGVVHRDIKPANILVGDLGETVVIDWGLAKVIGEPDEQTTRPMVDLSDALKTRVGIVYGTPGFMAPEQLRGAPVDERCDVYALGATLYHMLARTPPHHAKTADEMMKAAVAAPPTPIRELVDGVPPDLSTIVDKALAHDATLRYQNARALAEDLQRFLTGQLVKSHHYSTRDRVVRYIRKNRGLSAAAAALVVLGTLAVIRIVIERDRADAAAREARSAEQRAVLRTEQLTLSQARSDIDVNPTKAVAMVKPLAAKYWREVRAIATAARHAGVAWGLPASTETRSLDMSHDGLRVLAAGDDGVVRIHDLVRRATRSVFELHAPATARFADAERLIVIWHDAQLVIVDAQTGTHREVKLANPIVDLETIGGAAYWVDGGHALWQLELASATAAPTQIILRGFDEALHELAPSPDGRWIALQGDIHLLLYDRQDPDTPVQVTSGKTHAVSWSTDSRSMAVLMDTQGTDVQEALDITMLPNPSAAHRMTASHRDYVVHAGGRVYTVGLTGVAIVARSAPGLEPLGRKQLRGQPVGLVEARGGTVVAGAASGLTVMSDDGDHLLPVQGVRIEAVVASPRSPYVVARLEGRLLVWNLDEIQPRRVAEQPVDGVALVGADQVITGGTPDGPAQLIDIATGVAEPLGDWRGLADVAAAPGGKLAALVDREHRLHLVGKGREPEDLPGAIDLTGFPTDNLLVLTTLEGGIYLHDVARHLRTPLVPPRARLLGLAWGRDHPWVAAAFVDGKLWRKNLVTGLEASATRVPRLDLASLRLREGKLLVGDDGTVLYLHDDEIYAWRADGSLERLAKLPRRLDDLGEAGRGMIVGFVGDNPTYMVARDGGKVEPLAPIVGTSAAMSPDTGLVVVIDHGAVEVVDPLARQQWTLAPAAGVTFSRPRISTDGHRIVAQTQEAVVAWPLDQPETAEATARWVESLTNAVDDDHAPGGLVWR